MSRIFYAALMVAGLAIAPLPTLLTSAVAQTPAPATTPAPAPDAKVKTKKPPTPGQLAARERQKKCGAEWKAAKAAGKIQAGMKWPQYWSACNKRLKGGA